METPAPGELHRAPRHRHQAIVAVIKDGSRLRAHGFFVTGTDTGVGKTLVSCALLHAFAACGLRAVGMKPVAAGAISTADTLINEDVAALTAASTVTAPHELVNPYCFAPPVAPHIAAAETGVEIDFGRIEHAYRELTTSADCVIVEGAGGFRVPLGAQADTRDLAVRLALPVILVVGMRLGCLSHALLTAESVDSAGLRLAGWIANHTDPTMARADENVSALQARLQAPLLARIPYSGTIDAALVARTLHIDMLY
jgi:dethiobiotin synthetase